MTIKHSGIAFLALAIAMFPLAGNAQMVSTPSQTDRPSAEAASASGGPRTIEGTATMAGNMTYARDADVQPQPARAAAPTAVVFHQPVVRVWSPGLAAALSLVVPGAGQMYKGQVRGGLLWLGAVVVGYMTFIVPGLVLHAICVYSATQGDPMRAGRWS
jgi:hypothetical protein